CLSRVKVTMPKLMFATFWCIFLAVELAEHVLSIGSVKHPFALLWIVLHRELEQIRAFEEAFDPALECPLLQVRRGVKRDPAAAGKFIVNCHDPLLRGLMP